VNIELVLDLFFEQGLCEFNKEEKQVLVRLIKKRRRIW